jgi:hypothetical protein
MVNDHDDARETVSGHGHFLGGRVEEIHGDMEPCFSLGEEKRTQAWHRRDGEAGDSWNRIDLCVVAEEWTNDVSDEEACLAQILSQSPIQKSQRSLKWNLSLMMTTTHFRASPVVVP